MEVKGTALLAIRDFVKINHNNVYETWLGSLSEDSRQIFEKTIDSTQWYPISYAAIEPTKKISDLIFSGDAKKGAWESGRYSAEKGLSGIYRIFVKATSPSFIISRAKDVFAKYYRPCELRVINSDSNGVLLHMTGTKQMDPVIEYRIAGWIEKALEINGAKEVKVDITKSLSKGDEVTEFAITWK